MTSLHADEAFLGHYQFSHDPFAARVPGFRFFPAQRKPVLGQLHHLARYSQLLLVVTGPKGSGKTLLRQALVASTNKQSVLSIVASARGASDAAAVLRQVAQGLGTQQVDARSVQAQIAELAITGQEVYLLIDDAEQLADSALDALFSLATGDGQARAHVFLFAEPELLPRLELLADGEERFHPIELQPYSEDETREYLAQRLDGAGQGIDLLSDEQINDIHLTAQGWPGLINQAARDVLIESMMARRGTAAAGARKPGVPKKHVIAAVVVLLALGAAWFMQGRKDTVHEATTASQPAETEPAKAQEGTAIEFAGSNQPLPLPLVGQAQPVIREPLAQASGMAEGEESGAAASVTPPSSITPSVPVVNPAPVTAIAPVAAPVREAPAVASKPVTTPAKPVPAASAAKPAPQPAPASKPAVPAVAKATPAAGMAWYAAQPGASFALQILGTRSESAAQAFVSKNGGEYRYFKKLLQGQPLYVVTYGSFSSRTAAQAAIKTLPASVQAGKPWPKTFASIKQEAAQVR